ncbi:MAG: IS630 transposase-related protein [Defluviitaleaceae bacterium]|nr:IS630 transposase-related protein [Defluviitaleaceae bacterium]
MAYDKKYRENVLRYIDEGHTLEEAKKVFQVGTTAIKRWRKLRKETGSLQDRPRGKWHKKIDPVKLAAYYEENPDSYLNEAAEAFGCSITAIFKAKARLGITRKKN